MKFLIRRVQGQSGAVTFVDRLIEATSLRIGRGTGQDLEIADPRVALEHAEVLVDEDGRYRVEARTASGVWVNGAPCAAQRIAPDDELDFGRFHVSVAEGEGGADLTLLVEDRGSAAHPDGRQATPITRLQDTRLSRRGLAWTGVLLVLVSMLLVPLLLRYGAPFAGDPPAKSLSLLPTDNVWDSGPLASTHAYFESDCASCHVEPFERVRNQACLACHDMSRHHVLDPKLAASPDFADANCTDCHREHNGADGMIVRRASLCTDCHTDLESGFPGTQLASARSFSHDHPPFSPLLTHYDKAKGEFHSKSVQQGPGVKLREDTGLVFPHDLHVEAQGIDAPEGTRILSCPDCHVPDRGEISFEPVSMEKHCADCHRLEFDPDDPTRVVPHGKPAEVAAVLRDHFAARALTGQVEALDAPLNPLRRRPGPVQAPAPRAEAARWSQQQGEQAVREVFEGRVCRYCHIVEETGERHMPWSIAPLALDEHALRGARFTHKPHAVASCGDCHGAEMSKSSEDVLLPSIETCRECHGDDGGSEQVSSDCIDCHSYHISDAPLWDPQAAERKKHIVLMKSGTPHPAPAESQR